jgi:hypothetical protein
MPIGAFRLNTLSARAAAPAGLSYTFDRSLTATSGTSMNISTVTNGALMFLITGAWSSGSPTSVAPSGWTSLYNDLDSGSTIRLQVLRKIKSSDTSVSILTGIYTQAAVLLAYNPSGTITTYTQNSAAFAESLNAITGYTLTMTGVTGPYVGVAAGFWTAAAGTLSTNQTPSRTITIGAMQVKTFESVDSSTTFSTSSTDMDDQGKQLLRIWRTNLA